MAVAKVWEEAEGCWIVEELAAAAVARCKAILAVPETAAEEGEMEQAVGLLAKQKGRAEGGWLACEHCVTWGFDCQVSLVVDLFLDFFLTKTVGDGSQKISGVR